MNDPLNSNEQTILPHVQTRWMIPSDLPGVESLDKTCFPNPWLKTDYNLALAKANCLGMIAETEHNWLLGPELLGYAIYELRPKNLHIIRLATRPLTRRQGVGHTMVASLTTKLSNKRPVLAILVRETNLGAQHFFSAQGFRATLVVRGYFKDTGEDAYEMFYALGGAR